MIKVTLKDGSLRELEAPVSVAEFTKGISMGLYRNACCALVDGKVADLCDVIDRDCSLEILTLEDEQGRRAFNHTASHILAQAVQHLFPGVKFAIGPAIENGFYYDFDVETPFTPEDLEKLESSAVSLASGLAEKTGVAFSYRTQDVFPANINAPELYDIVRTAAKTAGLDCVTPHEPFRWSEDFGWYGSKTKSFMCGIGGGEDAPGLHTPAYRWNDEVTTSALRLFSAIISA